MAAEAGSATCERPRIGLVHALYQSMAPMDEALSALWPQAQPMHLYDASLYLDYADAGAVTPAIGERITTLLRLSEASGARAIVFTGSLFGDAVHDARQHLSLPVFGAYDALIDEALAAGTRLVLLTTLPSTAALLSADLERRAHALGMNLRVDIRVVADAFDALQRGDTRRHDALVAAAIESANGGGDAIVLGQYSMSPAVDLLASRPAIPLLSGPHAAVRRLRDTVAEAS